MLQCVSVRRPSSFSSPGLCRERRDELLPAGTRSPAKEGGTDQKLAICRRCGALNTQRAYIGDEKVSKSANCRTSEPFVHRCRSPRTLAHRISRAHAKSCMNH